jgi:hypothetical protein
MNNLDFKSNKICQPKLLNIELKEHQKTAIYAMNYIEQKGCIETKDKTIETNIGILSDKVGSGKSFMVIGLICHNKITKEYPMIINGCKNICVKIKVNNIIKTNLIIVPHGLVNQWSNFLKISKLKFKSVNKNTDIQFSDMDNIENYDVILLSANKYYNFMSKNDPSFNLTWNRIFIDESDSINIKNFNGIFANFIWFITATPYNLRHSLKHMPKYYFKEISYSLDIFADIFVNNNDEFVDASMNLPEYNKYIIICDTPHELRIVSKFIPRHVLDMINAGNSDEAIKMLNYNVDTNENIIEVVTKNIKNKLYNYEIKLEALNKMKITNKEEHSKKLENITKEIIRCKNRLDSIKKKIMGIDNEVCSICISEMTKPVLLNCECKGMYCFECIILWLDKKNTCPECRNNISKNDINVIDNEKKEKKEKEEKKEKKTKIDELGKILERNKKGKFLIFSVYDATFTKIVEKLNDQKLRYSVLKGTSDQISKTINKFEKGEINILMLNAQYYGSGLNLQMATDIIMFHRFNSQLEKQVIGRAHRLGRKEALNVHYLLYDNEA